MTTLLLCLLLLLWALVVYHHVGYPLLITYLSRPTTLSAHQAEEAQALPHIVMLVPAYNEAEVIADKVRNTACLDYPSTHFTLIIACDGCTDETANIARVTAMEPENRGLNIEVIEFKRNRGKVAVLNDMISRIDQELIALSDTSALLSMDGLQIAAGHFNQAPVGVVAATYRLLTPGSAGESKYWQYQTRILEAEARLGSPIGVHGALYFFRRRLFNRLAADTINDDFVLPMSIVAQGHQAVYEPDIIALELEKASNSMDQRRRVRISAGNLQQLLRLPELLNPRLGGIAFAFFSGKALRALMPMLLLIQLLLCGWLALSYDGLMVISAFQIIMLIAAYNLPRIPGIQLPTMATTLFYLINGYRCGLIGCLRYIAGLERGHWKPVSTQEISS